MNNGELKIQMEQYIREGLIEEANELIKQYKEIVGYDDDVASMEAVLNIYTENYEVGLNCIREGLKFNIYNSDLYFTMGNIYELKNEYDRAYLCYEKALMHSIKEENNVIISNAINNLKNNYDIKVRDYSIIILTYNQLEYTKVCINSIKNYNRNDNCEIIIVDNKSTDGTVEWIKEQEGIKYILNSENKGFPAGCNQGIEISNKSNDIFLLNNDTVIMPNSIFNLRMGLYSNEKIGATGAVSNNVSYYQQISEIYDDFDKYMDYALCNNISNEICYEERIKLVGFAMLIKREVLDKVGLLDEIFTPGNFEDDDISLRIISEGYKLLLCKDSYIHHFGSVSFKKNPEEYINLLKVNSNKFKKKWGFNSELELNIRYDLLQEVKFKKAFNKKKEINILDIGCGLGATLSILRKIPNINVYGVEKSNEIIDVLKNGNVLNGVMNIENLDFKDLLFDIIIISKEEMYDCIDELNNNISNETQIVRNYEIKNQENIQFTGERLVINDFVSENYNDVMQEHLSRYKLASKYVKDKIVIDAASGSGYGSYILSKSGAKFVRGFDISREAIDSAKYNYKDYDNINFDIGDVTNLDLPNNSADIFISFETIEHINCGEDLIKEASRVLKDDGLFIVSTPNRNATNPGLLFGERPKNIYHFFEYSPLEFIGDLSCEFEIIDLYGQTINEDIEFAKNRYMRKIFGKNEVDYSSINYINDYECRKIKEFNNFEPMYLIAICKKKNKLGDAEYREKGSIVENKRKYFIGENCDIRGRERMNFGDGVMIQENCWINIAYNNLSKNKMIDIRSGANIGRRSIISASNKIVIGENVLIAPNVYIADCGHEFKNINIPIIDQGIDSIENEIIIGKGSWIGINSVIIGNVRIGDNCVIGSNSFVNQDIPDYTVAVGSPAKIIKMFDVIDGEWKVIYNDSDVENILKRRESVKNTI